MKYVFGKPGVHSIHPMQQLTFIQRRINIDETSLRRDVVFDVNATLYKRHVPAGLCTTILEIVKFILTHLCRVDSPTVTLWTGPFPVNGVPG